VSNLDYAKLPGGVLIEKGLIDLGRGVETLESLLIKIAERKLKNLGIRLPDTAPVNEPELRFYVLLRAGKYPDPYSSYNSLICQMLSFCRHLERNQSAS
jgi:hypothetical protein